MDFTFGIITNGCENIIDIIKSIENENIPNYEIIIVGGNKIKRKNVIHLDFNENVKPGWITKKKNIITEKSSYDNIVYMHDYVYLLPEWYSGQLKFGENFEIQMNKIFNADGNRFRDWILWIDDAKNVLSDYDYEEYRNLLPYDILHLSKMMYISGAYWIAKKHVMEKHKLNEKLCWGQGEDVEWSIRVRNEFNFKMNENSSVKLIKQKSSHFLLNENEIKILKEFHNYDKNEETYQKLLKNHIGKWV